MADVWLGRVNRAVEKLLNIKAGPTVVDVDHRLQLVQQANTAPVEERYLQGTDRYALRFFQVAVAAQFAEFQIRNPANSNVLVTLEKATVEFAVAGEYLAFEVTSTVDLATPVTMTFQRWDRRSRAAPTVIASQTTAAALPANTSYWGIFGGANTSADMIQTVNQEIPILPGDAFALVFSIANANGVVSMWWRERPLESSELT